MTILLYVAALIAALALFIIAIFLSKTLTAIAKTTAEIQTTIEQVTIDVHGLLRQADELLTGVNVLMRDVNEKVTKIDPIFDAIGDMGTSLFGLSRSVREMIELATNKVKLNETKTARAFAFSNSIFSFYNKIKKRKVARDSAKENGNEFGMGGNKDESKR